MALKFENKFNVGDKIKSQDFFGKPEYYIAGEIIKTETIRGAKVYSIDIVEDILVITPERCFCITGITFLIIRNMPVRFTSSICLHPSADILLGPLSPGPIPTLFCKIFN